MYTSLDDLPPIILLDTQEDNYNMYTSLDDLPPIIMLDTQERHLYHVYFIGWHTSHYHARDSRKTTPTILSTIYMT